MMKITEQFSRPETTQEARQLLKLLSPGNKAAHKLVNSMSDESVIACAQRRYDDLTKAGK